MTACVVATCVLVGLIAFLWFRIYFMPRPVVERYNTGEVRKQYCAFKGMKVGEERVFYRSGKVNKIQLYRLGKRSGPVTIFYESGARYVEGCHRGGKLCGDYRVYEANGDLKHVMHIG